MLQISDHSIESYVNKKGLKSFQEIPESHSNKTLKRWLFAILLIFTTTLFLPWTQNIQSKGTVTTLSPEQRPQTVPSIIAGRIEKWFIREGDFVKKGDTIIFISEVKDDYFDPNLLTNTESQIHSKESSAVSYMEKVRSLDSQIDALLTNKNVKLQQASFKIQQVKLKIQSDSIEMNAVQNNLKVAEDQLARYNELLEKGLISETELEARKVTFQNTQSKAIDIQNKLMTSKIDLINAINEINSIENDFQDKISKAESEKFASLSSMYDTEAQVSKLQNQYANYDKRKGFYYVVSPQDGFITKTVQSGVGENIKEGEDVVSIMPSVYDQAVELYVEPMNLPLIQKGQRVRFIFDGWPAFVFSGWPESSTGTFGGEIFAIDNFTSPNGKYRMLVVPEPGTHWPKGLRVGTGANGITLLNDVPIWYELWRQFNGFPPDFYQPSATEKK